MEINKKFKNNPWKEILAVDFEGYPTVVRNKNNRITFPNKNKGKRIAKGCFGKSNIYNKKSSDCIINLNPVSLGTSIKL